MVGRPPREHLARLCALTRLALGETERAGQLTDDQADLALAVMERWLAGRAPRTGLQEALEEVREVMDRLAHAMSTPPALVAALHALDALADAVNAHAQDTAAGSAVTHPARTVTFWVEACLESLGEPPDAVRARIRAVYDHPDAAATQA